MTCWKAIPLRRWALRRAPALLCCMLVYGAAHGATQVVMLGTGTPLPDPDRSGPCTAIIVADTPYLVDAGPGLVRQAAAAARRGFKSLSATHLDTAFLTHLHSDHTAGLPDLILTPWVMGRVHPLELYGPPGLRAMTGHLRQAYAEDIKVRIEDLEHANTTGYTVNAHEIKPGVIYRDSNVEVTAFAVPHGSIAAFGYRFRTSDRVIVISGDTRASPAIAENCHGCDVLIHEVYTEGSTSKVSAQWQQYRRAFHTSTTELAQIAATARPRLLVLYHRANPGCDQAGAQCGEDSGSEAEMIREIGEHYDGKVVAAHDLDVY